MTVELIPSRQYWAGKLEEAEQSGTALAAFARQENIPAQKLYQMVVRFFFGNPIL